jgi:hypothetical protein
LERYSCRPQNQPGQVRAHKVTKQPRFNDKNEILCTYCVTYKHKEDFLSCNLDRKYYICVRCEYKRRKRNVGDVNRLIDNIFNHQKKSGEVLYTWDQFCDWLMKKTNFMVVYQTWKSFRFEKWYTPTVLRLDASKPFSLDNLRVTTAKSARELNVRKRERRVIQMDVEGKDLATYPNARVAAELLNYKNYPKIHESCKGLRKSAAGFKWRYA